jgi:hypothetical protein
LHLYPLAFLTISLVVLIVSQDLPFWVTEIAETDTATCSCPAPREAADMRNYGVDRSEGENSMSTTVRPTVFPEGS